MGVLVLLCLATAIFRAGECVPKPQEEKGPDDLLPPIFHRPGEVKELDDDKIDKALDDVMRAKDGMHDRVLALSIKNEGGLLLSNPRMHYKNGGTHSSPGQQIPVGKVGLNLMVKIKWTLTGSVGVITYDIEGTDLKLAIFWQVPYDRNLYNNLYNFKIYPRSTSTDNNMYQQMKNRAGPWEARGWEERSEYGINIRGTMTDNALSKMMVWIDSENFDAAKGPFHYTKCAYHPGKVRKMCWRECTIGWCWLDIKCSQDSECLNPPSLTCTNNC